MKTMQDVIIVSIRLSISRIDYLPCRWKFFNSSVLWNHDSNFRGVNISYWNECLFSLLVKQTGDIDIQQTFNNNNYIFAYQKYLENIPALPTLLKTPDTPVPDIETSQTPSLVTIKRKKSTKITSLGDKCAVCGKTFARLLQHLRMKVACQGPYDMDELEKEQGAKQRKRKSRALRTPDKVKEDRELNKIAQEKILLENRDR